MKKHLNLIMVLSLLPLLVSWKSEGSISMKLYSFTEYIDLSGKTEGIQTGLGHSFFVFYNNTSSSCKIGYYTLPAKESVSVGLWKKGSGSDSSDGSSSGGSGSSASSNGCKYNGIYYNREEYFYNQVQNMSNAVCYETVLTTSELKTASDKIVEVNDLYKLISYNCSTFTTEVWNLTKGTNWYQGWGRQPKHVMADVMNTYSDYINDNSLPSATEFDFVHYDKGLEEFVNE